MGRQPALALMVGIYMGGVYGGSRTAILLNIPGAPSAIATALDGYPLAQKGEAGRGDRHRHGRLGASAASSASSRWPCCAADLSDFALRFQPRDYMLLAIMGILLVGWPVGGQPGQGHLRRRAGRR